MGDSVSDINYLALGPKRSIAYRTIAGDEGLPTLVFLHEGLGCMAMWHGFPARLCDRLGCPGLLYDRQGYGLSSPLTARRTLHYLHEYGLNELPQVIAHLIPGRPLILVGHSDGGSIGLIHAAENPRYLMGVITEAAHVCVDKITLHGIRSAVAAYEKGLLDGLKKYHGAKTDGIFQAWARTWLAGWFQSWSLEYLLPAVDCPVLAIQGTDDPYGDALQAAKISAGVRGDAETRMVAQCGHVPHLEQPEGVLELMADFITRRILPHH